MIDSPHPAIPPCPLQFRLEWRGVSRISTTLVVLDLARSERMAQIAQIAPEASLAAVAHSMVCKPHVLEAIAKGAEDEAREESRRRRAAAPHLWENHSEERVEKGLAALTERALKDWAQHWGYGVSEWGIPALTQSFYCAADNIPMPLDLAPDRSAEEREEMAALMAAAARGATTALRAVAEGLFGADAVLLALSVSPQENHAGGFDTTGVALAEIERRALQEATQKPADSPRRAAGAEKAGPGERLGASEARAARKPRSL